MPYGYSTPMRLWATYSFMISHVSGTTMPRWPPGRSTRKHSRRNSIPVATAPPIPYPDASADEIWAGHFLQHLDQPTDTGVLRDCFRVLPPCGHPGLALPDTA